MKPLSYSKEYDLEEGLSKVKRLAKIRVTDAAEVYNVLTDEKQLALFLEEGLGPEHPQYKNQIIRFFTCIRDRISIEDWIKFVWSSTSLETRRQKNNECSIFISFANVRCVDCTDNSIWVCGDHHWLAHISEHTSASK